MNDIPKMVAITKAVVEAVGKPVTVKTRLGWDDGSKIIVELAERLQDVGIQALTIHGRTRCQMYKGEADWTLIGAVKNNPRMKIPIIGNGDIRDPESAALMLKETGSDGIMVARASQGNPWIFREIRQLSDHQSPTPVTAEERFRMIETHYRRLLAWKPEPIAVREMRKHIGWYLKGLRGAAQVRGWINQAETPAQVGDLLSRFRESLLDQES